MDGNLTEKQAEVLACVRRMLSENGYCPTVREICAALSLSSPSSVHFHLRALERKGYIRRDPLRPRTIEIVEKKGAGRRDFVRVPVIGTVAAGQPLLAEENVDGFFRSRRARSTDRTCLCSRSRATVWSKPVFIMGIRLLSSGVRPLRTEISWWRWLMIPPR